MADETLNVPPFPPLRWDEFHWIGELALPSWAGFQTRRRPSADVSSDRPADGTVDLRVASENSDNRAPPTQGQAQALLHLLENEATVATTVLNKLFRNYPGEKAAYEDAFDEDEGATLPDIGEPNEMRTLIGLTSVYIHTVYKDGAAYIGFEFGCVWDREHGAGVMTHLGRIVEVGQADCSFLEWIAERDAKRRKKKS
jgi:hypothetical protein